MRQCVQKSLFILFFLLTTVGVHADVQKWATSLPEKSKWVLRDDSYSGDDF